MNTYLKIVLETVLKFVSIKKKQGNKRISMILLKKLDKMVENFKETNDFDLLNKIAKVKISFANYYFKVYKYLI